ncbi:hypothetical protein [Methylobacterium nigriterrae]
MARPGLAAVEARKPVEGVQGAVEEAGADLGAVKLPGEAAAPSSPTPV